MCVDPVVLRVAQHSMAPFVKAGIQGDQNDGSVIPEVFSVQTGQAIFTAQEY